MCVCVFKVDICIHLRVGIFNGGMSGAEKRKCVKQPRIENSERQTLSLSLPSSEYDRSHTPTSSSVSSCMKVAPVKPSGVRHGKSSSSSRLTFGFGACGCPAAHRTRRETGVALIPTWIADLGSVSFLQTSPHRGKCHTDFGFFFSLSSFRPSPFPPLLHSVISSSDFFFFVAQDNCQPPPVSCDWSPVL